MARPSTTTENTSASPEIFCNMATPEIITTQPNNHPQIDALKKASNKRIG